MHYIKSIFTGYFLLIGSTYVFTQNKSKDSLELLDLSNLKERIIQSQNDTILSTLYIDAYIINAKALNAKNEIARGYYYKTLISNSKQTKERYYDSIIKLTNNLENSNYPTIISLDRGVNFYKQRKFKDALGNYLLALKLNKGDRKDNLEFLVNLNIALLKNRIGFDQEALDLYRKCWKYAVIKDFKTIDQKKYLSLMSMLSHSFRKMNHLDSALYYNNKGLIESKRLQEDRHYYHFVLNDGVVSYFEGDFVEAKDSLEKGLRYMDTNNNLPNMAVGNYYLGKVMSKLGHTEDAINYFKKVDTVFQLNNDILPETREAYRHLTRYYKNNGDLKKELVYIEKLLVVDSVLNDNYKFLSKNISTKFDTPKLIEQKEQIIEKLNNKNSMYAKYIYWILTITIAALVFGIFQYYRKKVFSRRFSELVENENQYIGEVVTRKDELSIPKDIVERIVHELNLFEKEHKYLNTEINLTNLAKQFSTNTNYLSRTVNHFKNKNFSSYLNELRVNYAFKKLKEDYMFRKYTINAIANEVGFKKPESFSKAFYKHYKIYPSFYIKSLNGLLKK